MRTFILADNQPITRQGLISLLSNSGLCFQPLLAADKQSLLELLCVHPDSVLVLDYTMFDLTGVQDLLNIRERYPESFWVLFSEELGQYFLRQVLHGSSTVSVVMKHDPLDVIETALAKANSGERFLCEQARAIYQGNVLFAQEPASLTPTEQLILREIAYGKTTKEIAADKNLSFHTVNTHRKNIFRKLDVNNVHEAIKYAIKAGIADLSEYQI